MGFQIVRGTVDAPVKALFDLGGESLDIVFSIALWRAAIAPLLREISRPRGVGWVHDPIHDSICGLGRFETLSYISSPRAISYFARPPAQSMLAPSKRSLRRLERRFFVLSCASRRSEHKFTKSVTLLYMSRRRYQYIPVVAYAIRNTINLKIRCHLPPLAISANKRGFC